MTNPKPILVTTPASTSNLGPGFDCFGLALNLYNKYEFSFTQDQGEFEFTNASLYPEITATQDNLVYQSYKTTLLKQNHKTIPGLKLKFDLGIPFCGGLGSSATAVLAGITAANHVLDNVLSKQQILTLATELDGHPDNVCASLIGGFTLCTNSEGKLIYSTLNWLDELQVTMIIPSLYSDTELARSALNSTVSLKDSVFNLSHASLMTAAIIKQDKELLRHCLKDKLHQEYRVKNIKGMQETLDAGVQAGAFATLISGSGAAVTVILEKNSDKKRILSKMQNIWSDFAVETEVFDAKIDNTGTKVKILT